MMAKGHTRRGWRRAAIWIGAALILSVAAGAVWWWTSGVEVEAAAVGRRDVRSYVEERAKTRLARIHRITAPFHGRALPVEVREGDRVSAGQVVAQMETLDLDEEIRRARAQVDAIEAEITRNADDRLERTLLEQVEALLVSIDRAVDAAEAQTRASEARASLLAEERQRTETAHEDGAATDIELRRSRVAEVEGDMALQEDVLTLRSTEAIRAAARIAPRFIQQFIDKKALTQAVLKQEREAAEAQLDRLLLDSQRASMPAPVDGIVLERLVEDRRVVAAGEDLLRVGRMADLEIEVEMLSDDVVTVDVGDDVEIFGAAIGPVPIRGEVSRVYPQGFKKISSLGVEQQRVLVIVQPDAEDLRQLQEGERGLGADFRVRVRVIIDHAADVVTSPRAAVFQGDEGEWRALVVRGRVAESRRIDVGLMNDRRVEVRSGLRPGERVILAPPARLKDGGRIRLIGNSE